MDLFPSLLRTLASLAAVLGLMLLVAYGVRRFSGTRLGLWRPASLIRVLGTVHFGAKREISVIEVGGTTLVVGMTASEISLLAKLDHAPLPDPTPGPYSSQGSHPSQGPHPSEGPHPEEKPAIQNG